MKIYISGQITGLDLEEAKRKFNDAERYLSEEHEVINPMKDKSTPLEECDFIYMLRGWQRSIDSCADHNLARNLNLKIISQR